MCKIGLAFAFVVLLSLLVTGCKDGGCKNDNDCKGARVCENGACVETKSAPQPPTSVPLETSPTAPADAPRAPTELAQPTASCMTCSTQEDFDAVTKRGRKCCPVTACQADSGCSNGRVCCRIPNGQICADAARCATVNRVASSASECNPPCKTGERCVRRRAVGATFVSVCAGAAPPNQCSRGARGGCPAGKQCCHRFANACPGGVCEDDPLTCEEQESCAD
jgi:hypothetical protein